MLEIFKPAYYQYLPRDNEAILNTASHITTLTREINTNEAMERPRVVSLIYSHIQKKLQLLRPFVKFRGNIAQDASVPGYMNYRDPLEAVDVTAIICGSKKEMCEGTRGSRMRAEGVLLMVGPDGGSSTCGGSTVRFWRLSHPRLTGKSRISLPVLPLCLWE